MDIRHFLMILRKRWRLIGGVLLLAVAVSAGVTAFTTPMYRATSQLFISTASGENSSDLIQGSTFTQRQVATYADLITTPAVLDPVIDSMQLEVSARDLAQRVTASVPTNTVLIDIAVLDEDPVRSAALANAIGDQFTITVQELERVGQGESPVKATLVARAQPPEGPASPNPTRNIALGLFLGSLLGLGSAILRDVLDTRVTTEQDVARVTDATVIGGIAFDKDASRYPLIVQADPHSPRAEAFRTLRTNLQFVNAGMRPRTIVFTSALPGEGKTTTTANLALTLAASGSSVVLIEGDLRRPRLLEYMGMDGSVGLTNVLIGEAEVDDVLQTFGESLTVLGAGTIPPNPSELLGSQAMANLLLNLEERFDFVVIDAPPLLPVTDAAVLARLADGAILVVGARLSTREQLHRALQNLSNVDVHVLGLVLNRLPISGPNAYTYYRDYRPEGVEPTSRRGKRAADENRLGLLTRTQRNS